jgi:MYXO-CTERM domain-containing protein
MLTILALSAFAGPHADHAAVFGDQRRPHVVPSALPPPAVPTVGPDLTVYGYLAYWDDDLNTVPWDELSHLAVFAATAETDGSLTNTSYWDQAADAVAMAQAYGVKVHLCVLNFDRDELDDLLNDPVARSTLVSNLATWQASTGADGINVDFEGVPGTARAGLVAFTQELEAAVGEVVLATPSVDWSDAFDYAALTDHADLFIMGYGYHWSGSAWAGPTDPLFAGSGTIWSGLNSYSLSWSLDDYLAEGADPDRVILGLPLYGRAYATSGSAIPSSSLGDGGAVFFRDAWDAEARVGSTYEPDSGSLMAYEGGEQIWFGDADTVAERIAYARDVAGVAGVGFWALNYDDTDPDLWAAVRAETTWSTGTGTGTTPTTPTTGTTPTTPTTPTTGTGPTTGTSTGTGPTTPTGTDGTDPTSTGGDGGLQAPEVEDAQQGEAKGCGCQSTSSAGWVALLGLLGLRRRR